MCDCVCVDCSATLRFILRASVYYRKGFWWVGGSIFFNFEEAPFHIFKYFQGLPFPNLNEGNFEFHGIRRFYKGLERALEMKGVAKW